MGTLILGAWVFSLFGLGVGHTIAENRAKDEMRAAGIDPIAVEENFEAAQEFRKSLPNEVAPGKLKIDRYGVNQYPRFERLKLGR
jgi:hypothetical protein